MEIATGWEGHPALAYRSQKSFAILRRTERSLTTPDKEEIARQIYIPIINGLKEQFGEIEFTRLWEEGRKLTIEQAIELAKQ